MDLNKIMENEMARSGGSARVVKVPDCRRPTATSLKKLGREISSQINANETMRTRSLLNASKASVR